MRDRWLEFVAVCLWALLASQHAFYAVGLGAAQSALGAAAYIELRNAIDEVMRQRLPVLYLATLAWTILLVARRRGPARAAFAVALVALLADVGLTLVGNVPINALMQTWTPAAPPADWEVHRAAWLSVFSWRQIAAATGFLATLIGALR